MTINPGDFTDQLGTVALAVLIAWLVITNKLVWHTRLKEVEARAERWERIALEALQTGARAGVQAAEVSSEVLAKLPDPGRRTG